MDEEKKSRRQAKYEKNGPKIVSIYRVRKGQGEFVRACVNLRTGQYEEYYRVSLSDTLVKVCRKATQAEILEEKKKQQEAVFDKIRKEYFRRHPDKDPRNQANGSAINEPALVANENAPVSDEDLVL